jgi:hypothetical protein
VEDVESVAAAKVAAGLGPGAAFVLNFDPHVTAGAECGADGELPAGPTGVAVQGGVGGQLGYAQYRVVGDGAFAE